MFGATAYDLQNEITTPTFKHPPNYKEMSLPMQADYYTISKGSQLVHVLDFCGHNMKLFQSNPPFVELQLNKDKSLEFHKPKYKTVRPEHKLR